MVPCHRALRVNKLRKNIGSKTRLLSFVQRYLLRFALPAVVLFLLEFTSFRQRVRGMACHSICRNWSSCCIFLGGSSSLVCLDHPTSARWGWNHVFRTVCSSWWMKLLTSPLPFSFRRAGRTKDPQSGLRSTGSSSCRQCGTGRFPHQRSPRESHLLH